VLCRFFSPAVRRVLTAGDAEGTLKPRETEVTVLFCDLRGFARKIEAWAYDLVAMLERVSQALGVMTQNILAHKGVIADFLGDAALGFWGWPIPEPTMISQACLAALGIRAEFHAFAQRHDHPLAEFAVGIGIATGRAVAGRIGTPEQAKVTVFGPIVNLASRLEGMTRILHAPILLDEATARVVRQQLPTDQARCRRLALVKPFGLDTPLTVHELLPPAAQYPLLQDEHLAFYEAAFEAFIQGQWSTAYEMLHRVPPQDLGKDFLTGFIIQNHHSPPPGWNGVVALASK
jgi:adenylate cyclase